MKNHLYNHFVPHLVVKLACVNAV